MTLDRAINLVAVKYEQAKKLDYIRNPLAYALYKVWKMADKDVVKPKKNPTPKKVSQETLNALNKMGQQTHTAEE